MKKCPKKKKRRGKEETRKIFLNFRISKQMLNICFVNDTTIKKECVIRNSVDAQFLFV